MAIILYFQYSVITSLKIVSETPAKFPAISICNLNAYDGDYSRSEMDKILAEKNISQALFKPIDYVEKAADYFKSTFNANYTEEELKIKGFFLNQMMYSCS